MTSNRRKTRTGLPLSFPAGVYNDVLDVTRDYKRSRSLGGAAQRGAPATETRVLIKNNSGSAISSPFSVLEISGRVGSDEDYRNKKTLLGVTPTSAARPVAILQAGAGTGELVEAVIGGTTLARVNIVSTSDRYADAVAGDRDKLKSGSAGRFEILEPPTGTGLRVVQVRFVGGKAPTGRPKVRNSSGYTVPEWGFLLVDGVTNETLPIFDLAAFKSDPVFIGRSPSGFQLFNNKRLVSVPGGAAPGEIVDCITDGRVPARVYSDYRTDPVMCHAEIEGGTLNGVTRLRALQDQSGFGFPILYRETGTGEKWALVDLSPQNQPSSIYGYATLPNGLIKTGQVNINTPYYYKGWPTTQLTSNSATRLQVDSTALRFAGPSSWVGEAWLTFSCRSYNHPSTSVGVRIPGFRAILKFTGNSTSYTHHAGYITVRPHLCETADSGQLGFEGSTHTIRSPFHFTAPNGLPPAQGMSIAMEFQVNMLSGNTGAGIEVVPMYFGISLREIDPFNAANTVPITFGNPITGTIDPGAGSFSSGAVFPGSVQDPYNAFARGLDPGILFAASGGLASGSGTGTGIS